MKWVGTQFGQDALIVGLAHDSPLEARTKLQSVVFGKLNEFP